MKPDEFADKLAFYGMLTDEEKELVKNSVSIKKFGKNEMIHSCTGACLGTIYVISGSIRVSIISEEGRELTLYKLGEGDTCVISAACVLHEIRLESVMTASEDTTVLILNSKALSKIVNENIKVKCYSYEIATQRFSAALFVLQEIILLRFDKRLAKYLLELSKSRNDKKLKITQETIAVDVNSAREVVARMLKQFELENLVKLTRGCIEITDEEGLRSII